MLTAAVVGAGTPPGQREPGRYGQGYDHAWGYHRASGVSLVACADIDPKHRRRFGQEFGLDDTVLYADHERLLRDHDPDVVSVCTPPANRPVIVGDCVAAGVAAIHCEKPLASTPGSCRSTVKRCRDGGVTLTVNHQRRFARPFRRAKRLLDAGAIGDLRRVAFGAQNLFDYGIHMFDLCGLLTDEHPVIWVEASLTYDTENRWYGLHNENRAVAHWRYDDGVDGVAISGSNHEIGPRMEVVGTDGRIQIGPPDGPVLRVGKTGDWHRVRTWGDGVDKLDPTSIQGRFRRLARNLPGDRARRMAPAGYTERGIVDLIRALRTDDEPALTADHSVRATELAFACYAAARRGDRVSLPLDVDHNPLALMVEEGRLDPSATG